MLEEAILSTDLKSHLDQRSSFKELVNSGNFNPKIDGHKAQLRQMLMTAADLSAAVKPWESQQRVAELVYSEFFDQGARLKRWATGPMLARQPSNIGPASNIIHLPWLHRRSGDTVWHKPRRIDGLA